MNVALVVVAVAIAWMVSGIALAAALGPRLGRCADIANDVADDLGPRLNRATVDTFRWILPSSVVVLALTSSTGLAAAGVLPRPAQFVAHSVLGTVGLDVPDVPDRTVEAVALPSAAGGAAPSSSSDSTGGTALPSPAGDDRAAPTTDGAGVDDEVRDDLPAEDLQVGDEAPAVGVPALTTPPANSTDPHDGASAMAPTDVPTGRQEVSPAPDATVPDGDDGALPGGADDPGDVTASVPDTSPATTTPAPTRVAPPVAAPRPPTTTPPTTTPPTTTPPPTTPPPTTPPPTTPPTTVPDVTTPPPTTPPTTVPDVTTPPPTTPPTTVPDATAPPRATGEVTFEASPDEGQRQAAAESFAEHLAAVEEALTSTGAELAAAG